MNQEAKYIKKLMGWCPYAKKPENGECNCSLNFGAPDQSGSEKARVIPVTLSKYSRLRTYTFLVDTGFSLAYGLLLARIGVNKGAFFAGLLICLAICLSEWKNQMHSYEALEKNPVIDSSDKQKLTWILTVIIPIIIFLAYTNRFLNMILIFSFGAGAVASMWLSYFQITYWEYKNHKKIYIKKRCGKWKTSYLIREEG